MGTLLYIRHLIKIRRDMNKKELKTLEEIWLEKLQPYDEKGYHRKKSIDPSLETVAGEMIINLKKIRRKRRLLHCR